MKHLIKATILTAAIIAIPWPDTIPAHAQGRTVPASPWGRFDEAVRSAFMRSEAGAFSAVTGAVKDLPEIARVTFVSNVIRGLGLESGATIDLQSGDDPTLYHPLTEALKGFENADELIALIKREARLRPEPDVSDDPPRDASADIEAVEDGTGNRGIVTPRAAIEPIDPRKALKP